MSYDWLEHALQLEVVPSPKAPAACLILLILNLLLLADAVLSASKSCIFFTSNPTLTSSSPLGLLLFCPGLQASGYQLQ